MNLWNENYEVTPTFAKVKGQFITLKDHCSAEKKVLPSYLKDHLSHFFASLFYVFDS